MAGKNKKKKKKKKKKKGGKNKKKNEQKAACLYLGKGIEEFGEQGIRNIKVRCFLNLSKIREKLDNSEIKKRSKV